jgi:hypothetical protein
MTGTGERPPGAGEYGPDSPFTLPGFFHALGEGRLLAADCENCEAVLIPPRPACYDCGSRAVTAVEQPREGEVYSYTAVHRPVPELEPEAPFTVAVVELESGARLTGRLAVEHEDAEIGMPVELVVREPTDREREVALDGETDWPVHLFEPR